jgi:transposase
MPMDRRGPKPQNNRQIINGMFYILRTGSLWRDVPERYGPYTSVYNRFNRYRESPRWQGADDRQLDCARASACLRCKKRVEFVVSVEAGAGSRRRSTRVSTPKAGRSSC